MPTLSEVAFHPKTLSGAFLTAALFVMIDYGITASAQKRMVRPLTAMHNATLVADDAVPISATVLGAVPVMIAAVGYGICIIAPKRLSGYAAVFRSGGPQVLLPFLILFMLILSAIVSLLVVSIPDSDAAFWLWFAPVLSVSLLMLSGGMLFMPTHDAYGAFSLTEFVDE